MTTRILTMNRAIIAGVCSLALHLGAGTALAQTPFACTGEAFIVQEQQAQLFQIDQSISPFSFLPIGGSNSFQINNLGFRRTDGLIYGYRLAPAATRELIRIDSTGTVLPLGLPAGLPADAFIAGDVSVDSTTMYLTGPAVSELHAVPLPSL